MENLDNKDISLDSSPILDSLILKMAGDYDKHVVGLLFVTLIVEIDTLKKEIEKLKGDESV